MTLLVAGPAPQEGCDLKQECTVGSHQGTHGSRSGLEEPCEHLRPPGLGGVGGREASLSAVAEL